ncbi:MAG: ribosomal-protein-alanine N-acetyltransferase [Zetaproteobacteria bacterium]|nr:ribosomal-protein-alanine N-acetyltransferase [Pseudobdellovibrionaceae bacterium]|tara:strand:- start:208 stop:660 length:453 start_codon:yes stop_codon:yes gene_type:complete
MFEKIISWQHTEKEKKQLRTFANDWGTDFWGFEQVLETLTRNEVFLWSVIDDLGLWKACLIVQVNVDQIDLLFIYVRPNFRKEGVGHLLMNEFIEWSEHTAKANDIFLEVRESNIAAIQLYKRYNFEKVGVRKSYYQDGETAIVMKKSLV